MRCVGRASPSRSGSTCPQDPAGRTEHGPWGLEAAEALGVEPGRVFKTLLARIDETRLAVGVVPVDRELVSQGARSPPLDGRRATMADPAEAERATGYVVVGPSWGRMPPPRPAGQRPTRSCHAGAWRLDMTPRERWPVWSCLNIQSGRPCPAHRGPYVHRADRVPRQDG